MVTRTTDPNRADQLWSVEKLTSGTSNHERYAIVNVDNGRRLAVRNNAAVLENVPPDGGPVWWSTGYESVGCRLVIHCSWKASGVSQWSEPWGR
ncbi:MAG: hypothetical protein GEV12_10055 [Micromonosporaceae bacterium]|nr:hypothetical protein [Micromonosporaceae bacterium]